jgi:hypothetical protein
MQFIRREALKATALTPLVRFAKRNLFGFHGTQLADS